MGANEGYSPCQTRTQARSRPCSCRPCRPRPCGCHGLTHHAPKHKQIQTITNTGIRGLQQCYKHSGCVCHTIIEQIDITVRVCEGSDSLCEWTDSLCEWTDSLREWTDSLCEWTDSLCEWTDSFHSHDPLIIPLYKTEEQRFYQTLYILVNFSLSETGPVWSDLMTFKLNITHRNINI